MSQIRSEWLRPLHERYLEGEAGPTPPAVLVAAALSGICAVAAAGMASVFIPISVSIVREDRLALRDLTVAAPMAVTAVALFFIFGIGIVAIPRRGWYRLPIYSGLTLGILALSSFLYVPDRDAIGFLVVRAGGAALCAFALVPLLRSRRAATWLAKKRHRAKSE